MECFVLLHSSILAYEFNMLTQESMSTYASMHTHRAIAHREHSTTHLSMRSYT
jgi:hypothetical protein